MPHVRPLALDEAHLAFPALRELRPTSGAVVSPEAFQQAMSQAYAQGYRLAGSFDASGEVAAAVAGYRLQTNLAYGQFLYLDDLSTLPGARGRGHAAALLAWLEDEARRQGCRELHLDSGVGPHRFTAHRQYLKAGLNIVSHHFAKGLS